MYLRPWLKEVGDRDVVLFSNGEHILCVKCSNYGL